MHIVIVVVVGLAALVLVIVAAAFVSRLTGRRIDGALVFIWIWLAAALANGYDGWANYGIPLVNEIGAFIPIFGIPVAAAWYWSRRTRTNG